MDISHAKKQSQISNQNKTERPKQMHFSSFTAHIKYMIIYCNGRGVICSFKRYNFLSTVFITIPLIGLDIVNLVPDFKASNARYHGTKAVANTEQHRKT